MKTGLLVLLILMLGSPHPARGDLQPTCVISMLHIVREDVSGQLHPDVCYHRPSPGEPFKLHFVLGWNGPLSEPYSTARLPFTCTGVQLTLSDWLPVPEPAEGTMTFEWHAEQVSGDLWDGLTLIWGESPDSLIDIGGREYPLLGSVEIESFDPAWPPEVEIGASTYVGQIYIDCGNSLTLWTLGFEFEDGPPHCDYFPLNPYNGELFARCFAPVDGDGVAGLFHLDFDVRHEGCGPPPIFVNYTGTVRLFDDQILEFSHDDYTNGWYEERISAPIDVSGLAVGTIVPILVRLEDNFMGRARSYSLNYIVDDTATEPSSYSAIKSLY